MLLICVCCCCSESMELDLGSKGGVHTKLAGMEHRVFWPAERKLEGHTEEEEGRASGDVRTFLSGEGGEESRRSFLCFPWISQVYLHNI